MKLQILVSSLNQEVKSLAEKMNLQADAILINQCNENRYEEWTQDGHRIRCYHLAERGVGLSRNNALLRADADLCLFSDEDIVYDDGAVERIIEGFEQHPEADMLLFNVRVQESRFTYWNSFYKRVRWYNCGRYPAYSFALRTAKMHEKNLTYSLLFGGGAKYANGEDSLFIHDCLKAGLKVYSIPVEIGEEQPRPSTWFFGFDRKFFHDRGVLYHVLYGKLAAVMGFRFLLKNKSNPLPAECRQLLIAVTVNIFTIVGQRTGRWLIQAGKQMKQGTFSASRWSHNRNKIAGYNFEIRMIQSHHSVFTITINL